MSDMKLWHNGIDWVVAPSAARAREIVIKQQDCSEEWADGDLGWEEWAPDRPLTVHDDDGGAERTMTGAQWVAESGEGFLCSTEW